MSEAVGGVVHSSMSASGCGKLPPLGDDLRGDVVDDVDCDRGVRDLAAVVVDEKRTVADHVIGGCGGPVTIVQTTPSANPPGTVIVTVSSANNDATNVRCRETEMDILAHL
jgi:hypothetical protein